MTRPGPAIDTRMACGFLGILMLGLAIRVGGIALESFWVDEAFTAWASAGAPGEILERNARDIHPPAYYLGLHFWRVLTGDSDVAMRAYSTVWSLAGVALLMLFAKRLFGLRVAVLAGVLAAINPLDVYFAQEARMYAQTTTLCLATSFALWRWYEASRAGEGVSHWWRWAAGYSVAATLLLLTHYVAVTFLIGQGLVAIALFASRGDRASLVGYGLSAAAVGLAFSPWLVFVLGFRDSIVRVEGLEWMPFPGVLDYVAFMGREYFWGRAVKIHDVVWIPTIVLPLVVLGMPAIRFLRVSGPSRERWLFLFGHLAAPLLVCAIVSASFQVIYYRPRYVVILLPYFLLLLAWSCTALRSRRMQAAAATSLALLMMVGTWMQQQTPQKRAWRETAEAWPDAPAPAFYVILPDYHQRSLSHYLAGRVRHTPQDILERLGPLPRGAHIWVASWPEDLGAKDAEYRAWLEGVGPARSMLLPTYYSITRVEPEGEPVWPQFARDRFRAWYRPFDISGEIAGFSDATRFSKLEFDADGAVSRRADSEAWLRVEGISADEVLVLNAGPTDLTEFAFYLQRGPTSDQLFTSEPVQGEVQSRAEGNEIRLVAPPGSGSLWLGWRRAVDAHDDEVDLRISWLGVATTSIEAPDLAIRR